MESGTQVVAAKEGSPPGTMDIEPCMPVGTVALSDVGRIGDLGVPFVLLGVSSGGVEVGVAGACVFAASVGEDGGGEGGTVSSGGPCVGDCGPVGGGAAWFTA